MLKKSAAIKSTKKDPARGISRSLARQYGSKPYQVLCGRTSRARESDLLVSRSFAPRIIKGRRARSKRCELCKATPVATVQILHKVVEDNSCVEKIESFLVRIGNLQAVLEV